MAGEPIEELLGAYALDALDDHERRQVEAYLETNPRARAEVEELREVASMLAMSSERPPDGLWDRIAGELEESAPAPGPDLARVLPHRRRWSTTALVGVASGLVAAAAAAVITVAVLRDDDGPVGDVIAAAYDEAAADPAGRRTRLQSTDGSMTAEAVVTPAGIGYLAATALPELPADETYQLWGVYEDEDVISLGVIGNRPGIEPFTARGDVVALVITKEQSGGVVSSTTGAVLVGEL